MVDVKELRVQFFLLVGNFMHHTTKFLGVHRHVFHAIRTERLDFYLKSYLVCHFFIIFAPK